MTQDEHFCKLLDQHLDSSSDSAKKDGTYFPKSVAIFFRSQCHKFRIFKKQKFSEILESSCKHWELKNESCELRDEDGCIIPEKASVAEMFTYELSNDGVHEGYIPHLFLYKLDDFCNPVSEMNNALCVHVESPSDSTSYGSSSASCFLDQNCDNSESNKILMEPDNGASIFPRNSCSRCLMVHSPSMPMKLNRSKKNEGKVERARGDDQYYFLDGKVLASSFNSPKNFRDLTKAEESYSKNYFDGTKNRVISGLNRDGDDAVRVGSDSGGQLDFAMENDGRESDSGNGSYFLNDKFRYLTEEKTNRMMVLGRSFGHSPDVLCALPSESREMTSDAKNFKMGIQLLKGYESITIDEVFGNKRIQSIPTSIKLTHLVWELPPRVVLLIKKPGDPEVSEMFLEVSSWLIDEKNLQVLVEPSIAKVMPHLKSYTESESGIDLVISFGGDGTVLYINSLFQKSMPPVMAFNIGSLGFLTPFRYRNYRHSIDSVLKGCNLMLRSRLYCVVRRFVDEVEIVEKYTVLNEVIIERGSSPYLSNLECFCDGHLVTTIQGDGIIISSTTGSTAYSLSAGGSMVHPQVPAILFTPICPHSLSFRPVLFPDSVELKIKFPYYSRGTRAWVSFDGRHTRELHHGDYIVIRISKYPFVWVSKNDAIIDWFKSLGECLNWNNRIKQKSFCKTSYS